MGTSTIARRALGPAVRRARREWQWHSVRRQGGRLDLAVGAAADHPHPVTAHATPLIRDLAGLEHRLQVNKVTNLRLAVAPLDGRVVAPGCRLSFWWLVGRPSARRGYLEGLVLDEGRLTAGVGGGLCQLTNLIYWMTLHTPLTVVERWRHTYDVFADSGRTQPFGSGATCAYPALDLQLENRTSTAFRLGLTVGASHLAGRWTADRRVALRYSVYETDHEIVNEAPGAYVRRNILRRKVFDGDTLIADEPVAANRALLRYQPFLTAG
jgi:vancomycin resistance protein VanW